MRTCGTSSTANAQDGDKAKGAIAIDAFPGLGKTTAVLAFARKFHLREIAEQGLTPDGHERLAGLPGRADRQHRHEGLQPGHAGVLRPSRASPGHHRSDGLPGAGLRPSLRMPRC